MRPPRVLARFLPAEGGGTALATVAGGNLLGQLILFLASPILSRLYSPDAFSTYAIVLSASMVLAPLLSLGFQGAVPIAQERAARRLLVLAALCITCMSALMVVFQGPVRSAFTALWGADFPALAVWQIVSLSALASVSGGLSSYLLRPRAFAKLARNVVMQQSITVAAQTAFAATASASGLVYGVIIGRVTGMVGLLFHVLRVPVPADSPPAPSLLGLGRLYWRFPILFAPIALISAAGGQVVLLLLPGVMTPDELGQYAMASRILLFPVGVISLAVASVFLSELAQSRREERGDALQVFLSWTRLLSLAGVLVFVVGLAGPWLAPWFLGPEWATAGSYMQLMSLGVAVSAVASPLDHVWTVYQRAWSGGAWQVSRLLVLIGVLLGAIHQDLSVEQTLLIVSIVTALLYCASWLSCWRIVRSVSH